MKYIVELPYTYLMQIASAGNMGGGDLLKSMSLWAERECIRLGLEEDLKRARKDNLKELRIRMKNTFGNKFTKKAEQHIKDLTKELLQS